MTPQTPQGAALSDADIIEIRDELLPSQGEAFDTLGFARAILAAADSRLTAKGGAEQRKAPAFILGGEDFRRGHKTNPFQQGRQKRQWQAGWDRADRRQLCTSDPEGHQQAQTDHAAEQGGADEFVAFFKDRCELLFMHFGMEAINLYNRAALTTQRQAEPRKDGSISFEEAQDLARRRAKAEPESYYSEPFEPHLWVINAIVEASATWYERAVQERVRRVKAEAATAQPQAEPAGNLYEAAKRLVEHADFKLGGVLSADSKRGDIPSNAMSYVKARHLASLRDAVARATPATTEPKAP